MLDPAKLTAAGLSVVDVADALAAENTIEPVGRFAQSGQQHLALASGLWTNVHDIEQAPVLVKNGATVRVVGSRHGVDGRTRSHAARHR